MVIPCGSTAIARRSCTIVLRIYVIINITLGIDNIKKKQLTTLTDTIPNKKDNSPITNHKTAKNADARILFAPEANTHCCIKTSL